MIGFEIGPFLSIDTEWQRTVIIYLVNTSLFAAYEHRAATAQKKWRDKNIRFLRQSQSTQKGRRLLYRETTVGCAYSRMNWIWLILISLSLSVSTHPHALPINDEAARNGESSGLIADRQSKRRQHSKSNNNKKKNPIDWW